MGLTMNDETPITAHCPNCENCMEFKGIDYYQARELYICERCAELHEIPIPDMLPRAV
jgi:hypothetical protein